MWSSTIHPFQSQNSASVVVPENCFQFECILKVKPEFHLSPSPKQHLNSGSLYQHRKILFEHTNAEITPKLPQYKPWRDTVIRQRKRLCVPVVQGNPGATKSPLGSPGYHQHFHLNGVLTVKMKKSFQDTSLSKQVLGKLKGCSKLPLHRCNIWMLLRISLYYFGTCSTVLLEESCSWEGIFKNLIAAHLVSRDPQ